MDPAGALGPPAGYVSEEARQRFTLWTGILGTLFFFGQFLGPMIALPLFVFTGAFRDMEAFSIPDLRAGTYWGGYVWYPERRMPQPALAPRTRAGARLMRVSLCDAKDAMRLGELDSEAALFADGEHLWAISPESVTLLGPDGGVERRVERSIGNASSRAA